MSSNKKGYPAKSEPKGITFDVAPEARRQLRIKAAQNECDYTSLVQKIVNNLATKKLNLIDEILAA